MSLVRRRSSQMAYVPPAPPMGNCLCFTATEDEVYIFANIEGELSKQLDIKYSYDQITWVDFPIMTSESEEEEYVELNEGESIYIKGNNPDGLSESMDDMFLFGIYGYVYVSGNVMSLIDDGACTTTVIPNDYCFCRLFANCQIMTPPELPATQLKPYCYYFMFIGTELEEAPELPATTLAECCYAYMFYGSLLETAPELPATTLAEGCYGCMFYGSEIQTIPELPATTLAEECYTGMFSNCIKLQVSDTQNADAPYAWTIPESGVFTNTYEQEYMFYGCEGTRESDTMAGVAGQSYTYYTQNPPV